MEMAHSYRPGFLLAIAGFQDPGYVIAGIGITLSKLRSCLHNKKKLVRGTVRECVFDLSHNMHASGI